MNNERTQPVDIAVEQQQEIVHRYAVQIREEACGGPRPVSEGGRRCYELLNDCAMELAQLTRARRDSDQAAG